MFLLDSGCSFTILMRRLITKLRPKKDAVMQWYMQAGDVTTNLKVKIDFTYLNLAQKNCDM